jgi:hypothetical protein
MKVLHGLRASRVLTAAALATLIAIIFFNSSWAQAGLLGLQETYPDIFCSTITVDYSNNVLSTTCGYPAQFTYPKPGDTGQWMYHDPSDPDLINKVEEPLVYAPWPTNGFAINLTLDSDNNPTGGGLTILGYIPQLQDPNYDPYADDSIYYELANTSELLSGDIVSFGYQMVKTQTTSGGDIYLNTMEFVFNSTDGFLKDRFYPGQIGVSLSWNSFTPGSYIDFAGSFNSDTEDNQQPALADVFVVPVPEPSSVILLLTATGCVLLLSKLRGVRGN